MVKPIISVITVVYNSEKLLERTILSVLNQSYTNIEYVIIDGASTDTTVDIIKKYSESLAFWISEPDKGIYDAMNKGINHIRGEWIIFMNSGDIFYSDQVVEHIFDQYYIPENKIIIYGDTILDYGNYKKMKRASYPSKLWKRMIFSHQSSLIRTDIMKQYYFDISYRIAADYNLFISLWNDFGDDIFYKIDITISCYDAKEGISNKMRIHSVKERQKVLKLKKLITSKKKYYYFYLRTYLLFSNMIIIILSLLKKREKNFTDKNDKI
jgi:glycosyltransferase involved in cell wall biosynthesis